MNRPNKLLGEMPPYIDPSLGEISGGDCDGQQPLIVTKGPDGPIVTELDHAEFQLLSRNGAPIGRCATCAYYVSETPVSQPALSIVK